MTQRFNCGHSPAPAEVDWDKRSVFLSQAKQVARISTLAAMLAIVSTLTAAILAPSDSQIICDANFTIISALATSIDTAIASVLILCTAVHLSSSAATSALRAFPPPPTATVFI